MMYYNDQQENARRLKLHAFSFVGDSGFTISSNKVTHMTIGIVNQTSTTYNYKRERLSTLNMERAIIY